MNGGKGMDGRVILDQIGMIRSVTLETIGEISDEEADVQPKGWNNTIRWHLGHIYLVQERLAFHFAGFPLDLPQSYIDMFCSGTKPSDWKSEPPSLADLAARLAEQPDRIRALLCDKLEERPANPFPRFDGKIDTIGGLLTFSLFHEGLHNASIRALKRAVVV